MKAVETLETVGGKWQPGSKTWDAILQGAATPKSQLVFASQTSLADTQGDLRGCIAKTFKFPPLLLSQVCFKSNGFAGCEPSLDGPGHHIDHSYWARFVVKQTHGRLRPKGSFIRHQPTQGLDPESSPLPSLLNPLHGPKTISHGWEWYEMSLFVRWTPASTTILCFDLPEPAKASVRNTLLSRAESLTHSDPYAILAAVLIPEIVALYDNSVWSIRNHICEWEATRKDELDYGLLHEIARHAIHISETLSVASESARRLQQQFQDFGARQTHGDGHQSAPHNPFSFLAGLLEGLFARSESNKARLQNEIMLAFHTAAQHDSKTQVQIGEEAKKETAAMKAIAVITMTFLPATFISSVFSTPFFFFEPGHESGNTLTVSSQFWIYCAFAIPISLLTWGLWTFWDISSRKKQARTMRWPDFKRD
ncbi:hypothetical protein QBC34DRAFT_488113 [Podospora aff. communis PSN243]|uniref:Uncharacterized protein n=1 Tax=Podospora aff. communis PSN243 TaxID=3040156 RepID=A0AAV9G9Q3_9PEZI|nr:hypothetical protein QBC34DRAFT_488113 [Podospora aff. communis PSN243]